MDTETYKARAVEQVVLAINPESKVKVKDPVGTFDILASNKEAIYQLQSFLPPRRPNFNNRYVVGMGQKVTNKPRKADKFKPRQQEPPTIIGEAVV